MIISSVSKTLTDFTQKVDNNGKLVSLKYNLAQPNVQYAVIWMSNATAGGVSNVYSDVTALMNQRSDLDQQKFQFVYFNRDYSNATKQFVAKNYIRIPSFSRLDASGRFEHYDMDYYDANELCDFLLKNFPPSS